AYGFAAGQIERSVVAEQFIQALLFSGVVFLVSRRYYAMKSEEFLKRDQMDEQSGGQLKSIEKTLLSINRNLLQGVFRIDENGGLIYANDYLVSFLGYRTAAELKAN